MKPLQLVHSLRSFAPLLAAAVMLAPAAAIAQEKANCSDTAERVLTPYLTPLEAAKKAAEDYRRQNADLRARLEKHVESLQGLHEVLGKLERKQVEQSRTRERLAREALKELEQRDRSEIDRLRRLAAELRAAGRQTEADRHAKSADDLAKALTAGTRTFFKPQLNLLRSGAQWRKYIADTVDQRQKMQADFAAGLVAVFHPPVNRRMNWQQASKSIADTKRRIAASAAGEPVFFLPAVQSRLDEKGVESLLAKRRAELEDARSRIRAGTFVLFVPAINRQADRNHVQSLIADAKQAIRAARASRDAGTYRAFNRLLNAQVTNGELQARIASKKKEIAEIGERGDQRVLSSLEAKLAALNEALKEHRKVFEADLAARRKELDTKLATALAQTPCGASALVGPDPRQELIDRHLRKLRGMSEDGAERKMRADDYLDRIYVETDGTIHGDPRDAWLHATRDTGTQDPSMLETGANALKQIKDLTDWLGGFAELEAMRSASAKVSEFISAMEALDPGAEDFFAQRRTLRTTFFSDMEELVERGLLSKRKIDALLRALKTSGSGSLQVGLMKKRLRSLRTITDGFREHSLPRMRAALGAGEKLSEALASRYRTVAAKSLSELAGGWAAEGRQLSAAARSSWKKMSKLDRGLLALSLASAAAEVVQNTGQGMSLPEAVARSSVNLAIDFAIAGFPVTAAAEMGTQVLFTSYSVATGDTGVADATLSNTAKWVAGKALDGIAAGAASLGHGWSVATRRLAGEPDIEEALDAIDFARLRSSLSHVEDRIDALPPGDPDEPRLLRMRQVFRALIRAKQARD